MPQDFNEFIKDARLCEALASDICRSANIDFSGRRIYEGSRILFEIAGNRIVKIFPEDEASFCSNESEFLKLLHGKLSAATPELLESGTYSGYPFIIMSRIKGFSLKSVWNEASLPARKSIMRLIAQLLKELHSLSAELVHAGELEWTAFISSQLSHLQENHRNYGMRSEWINSICEFTEKTEPIEFSSKKVICHTEIMREHLFVTGCSHQSRICGLIDFEPSMVAIPEYDFCSVGLFITAGEKELFRYFLQCYGYTGESEGIMRMLLLHRYSNMKRFISAIPAGIKASSPEDLCNYWF
jgi:hygromycin-B 7''-O-kinase